MTTRFAAFGAALLATTALTAGAVSAETLRWARAAEALTLDPHSQNEGPTTTLMHQIYEPLIIRNMEGADGGRRWPRPGSRRPMTRTSGSSPCAKA
jgi:peptide/nickel transport system substrate-binding protein